MTLRSSPVRTISGLCLFLAAQAVVAADVPPPNAPEASAAPRLEFVFEEVVMLEKANHDVVIGDTPFGNKKYVPLAGGTVSGPRFNGKVLPGGWGSTLLLPNGCRSMEARYMLQADDETVVHVTNRGVICGKPEGPTFGTPVFEAPQGAHGWLTAGVFVASVARAGTTDRPAVRIRFYQVH